jgi:Cd2+/Zn2+-exporting ATPase
MKDNCKTGDSCCAGCEAMKASPTENVHAITGEQRKKIQRILSALALMIIAIFLPLTGAWSLISFLPAYLLVGYGTLKSAFMNILRGEVFDENFLMSIATIGAFVLGEYPEAVSVMLFYQIGELFESYGVNKSRRSIAKLMDIRPDYANLLQDGQVRTTDPSLVLPGQQILIRPGEKVPLDGRILEGSSSLDTRSLTGESIPRDVTMGDEVISGCINMSGVLTVEVTRPFSESTVARILDMVENASDKKADFEAFITRFARVYTPVVVVSALLLALVPPLLMEGADFSDWFYRALTFLVISCPCALVISVPLTFFAGIGASSHAGILVKGSNYLEALAKTETVVFDKTGTLTKGEFQVAGIYPAEGFTEEQLTELAALAEYHSNHPISQSLKHYYQGELAPERITDSKEIPGQGISVRIDGQAVLAGNNRLMEANQVNGFHVGMEGTLIHLAVDGKYAGTITVSDQLREDARDALTLLRSSGVKKTVMLTGDKSDIAEDVSTELGIDETYAHLLPGDKVSILEKLLADPDRKGTLAFVGDGINDAPVLARSDVGIAMGGLGSDAAIEAADVVIMNDQPSQVPVIIRIARGTLKIARQNVAFALGIKFGVLILGALGLASIWAAVFADVGVTVLAILNAMRALKLK